MIELRKKNNEIDIQLKFYQSIGGKVRINIYGEGDLSHHLIEGIFDIVDKLSLQENCSHLSEEWKELSNSKIKARMKELAT